MMTDRDDIWLKSEIKGADDIWLRYKIVAMLQRMIAYDIVDDMAHIVVMRRCRRLLLTMGVEPCTAEGATLLERKWEQLNAVRQPKHSRGDGPETHNAQSTARQSNDTIASWLDPR